MSQRRTGKYYGDVDRWLKEKGISVYRVSKVLDINFRRMQKIATSEFASSILLEDALKLYYFSEGELKLEQILGRQCRTPNTTYKKLLGSTNNGSEFKQFVEETKRIAKSKK